MKITHLDSILGDRYPHAGFHDGRIESIDLDYLKQEATFGCKLYVGNPNSLDDRETTARGVLHVTGLLFCAIEPPDENYCYDDGKGLDIANDGQFIKEDFKSSHPRMPGDLPEDAFVYYFYFTNCNSYMFIAATGASFQWL